MFKSEVKLEVFVGNMYEISGNTDFANVWFEGLEIDPVLLKKSKSCFFGITLNLDCIKIVTIIQKLKLH